jgi:mono/diheme cytochrome c family protein
MKTIKLLFFCLVGICANGAVAEEFSGYYKLQTLFQEPDNKCLEGNKFASSSTLKGAAFMDTCQNVSGQYWKFVPGGNGYYRLKTLFQEPDNKCLEGNKFATTSTLKGAAFMDTCQNVSGQLWKLLPQNNGYYKMQTQFQAPDNKCFEGNKFAASSTLGGAAFMDTCQDVSGQLWKFTQIRPEQPFPVSAKVPHDVTSATTAYPAVSLHQLASFAWQEFIALNHPADPTHRGQAKPNSKLSDAGDARVWETFWHRVEMFPASQTPVQTNGKANVTDKPVYDYSPAFKLDAATYGNASGTPNNQLWNNLDEDNELNVDEMFAHVSMNDNTPVGFDDENRIIFEAKMNEAGFNYILAKKLYNTNTRDSMAAETKKPANLAAYAAKCGVTATNVISLPCGQIGAGEGNIEIKAAWRKLNAAETSSGKYYTNSVIRYQSVSGTNKWFNDTYGLVGLHIIHKTVNFPTYVYATFEHNDNLASGIGYIDEITQTGRGAGDNAGEKKVITKRDHPIPAEVALVNASAQKAITGSVWENYQLVGVQAYPVDYSTLNIRTSPADKSTYYLSNLVIESNEELQNFRGAKNATQPDADNIFAHGKNMNMGGCMGCHGVAELNGTDFNFLIKNSPFTSPEVVGGSGVINFINVNTYKDVQSMFDSYVSLNGIAISGSPHKKFWDNLTYQQFITGDVPYVSGVKILKCGDSANSNLVNILKGSLPNGIPEMPAGGPYFPEEQIDSFAKWVDAGCKEK